MSRLSQRPGPSWNPCPSWNPFSEQTSCLWDKYHACPKSGVHTGTPFREKRHASAKKRCPSWNRFWNKYHVCPKGGVILEQCVGTSVMLVPKWAPCWNFFSGQASCLFQQWGPCWNPVSGQVSCLSLNGVHLGT